MLAGKIRMNLKKCLHPSYIAKHHMQSTNTLLSRSMRMEPKSDELPLSQKISAALQFVSLFFYIILLNDFYMFFIYFIFSYNRYPDLCS